MQLELQFEVVIDSPEYSVDMKSGLDTLQGVSDAMRKISESLLNDEVVKRINFKSDVRTTLKRSFKGSFGQKFSLSILGKKNQEKINELGVKNFIDIVHFIVMESRYGAARELSKAAKDFLASVRFSENDLVEEIRSSCMKKAHKVPGKFGHNVVVRFSPSNGRKAVIGKFDSASAKLLNSTFDPVRVKVYAGVTRLNINTGNGRIQLVGENVTTAFGFSGEYADVELRLKKMFSENLDDNNGVHVDAWKYLELTAQRVKLKGGKVVKYMVVDAA